MEYWRDTWRRWAAPLLSTKALEALRRGLVDDDPAIVQGQNTLTVEHFPKPHDRCVGGCPLAYAGWKTEELDTVEQVEAWFAALVNEINMRSFEPAAASYLLGWIDDTPRCEMRQALLIEVQRELARRGADEGRVAG